MLCPVTASVGIVATWWSYMYADHTHTHKVKINKSLKVNGKKVNRKYLLTIISLFHINETSLFSYIIEEYFWLVVNNSAADIFIIEWLWQAQAHKHGTTSEGLTLPPSLSFTEPLDSLI